MCAVSGASSEGASVERGMSEGGWAEGVDMMSKVEREERLEGNSAWRDEAGV